MKLFKKVMASVLAGVLALSMVACGTTVGPEIPDDPAAEAVNNAAVESILKYINEEVRADLGEKKVVNDENLAKYAQAQLDVGVATAFGELEGNESMAALQKQLFESEYTTVENVAIYALDKTAITAAFTYDTLTSLNYTGSAANNAAAKALAEKLLQTDKTQDPNKVGIATKVVNGKTYVLIATAATMA